MEANSSKDQNDMQIPTDKSERVRTIFQKLADSRLSRKLHEVIGGWFLSEDSRSEKEEQLFEHFNKTFDYTENPSKDAYRSFQAFARKAKIETSPARIPLRRQMLLKVAAVLIPALIITGIAFKLIEARVRPGNAEIVMVTLSVPVDDEQQITLPDNTVITLAQGSELRVAESFDGNRYVELKGEARFNVAKAKDESDAFRVKAGPLGITVLGTEFKVHSIETEDSSTIDLFHGRIVVEVAGQEVTMSPGDRLQLDQNTGTLELSRISLRERVYDNLGNLPSEGLLSELLRILEEEYNIPVETEGELPAIRIRGDFSDIRTLERLMYVWEKASGQRFTYDLTDTEIIIKSNDK